MRLLYIILLVSLMSIGGCDLRPALASFTPEIAYSDEKIADAIWLAEGSEKAKFTYGIRSISYKNKAEARQICLNTIRNQRKRHSRHNCGKTYLECLAERYCPTQGKLTAQEKRLNRYWLKNVLYYLNKK